MPWVLEQLWTVLAIGLAKTSRKAIYRAKAAHGVVYVLTKYFGVSTTSYAVNDDVSDFPMIVNIVMDHVDAVPV